MLIKRLGSVFASVTVACLFLSAVADAQVRSWSYTFNPNSSTPSFQPPAPLPLITFTASYDNAAGTLTISESGGDSSYYDYWQDDDWAFYPAGYDTLSDSALSGSIGWVGGGVGQPPGSSYFGPLTVDGVNGSLQGTNSVSGDTITATYSSPLLQGLNWVTAGIGGDGTGHDNSCLCDLTPDYNAYFVGYLPSIAINFADRTTNLRANVDQTLHIPIKGLSSLDDDITPTVRSVRNLPPGLSFSNVENGDGTTSPTISGTTTKPGVYHVAITATAAVASGSQVVTTTGRFTWTIPPPIVNLPDTDFATPRKGLEVKPDSIVDSGDDGGFIAGTSQSNATARRFGYIHWSSWSYSTGANGTGRQWINNCDPDCAGGTFTGYAVRLHADRPALIGGKWVFSQITLTYTHARPRFGTETIPRTETLQVRYMAGYYEL